MPRGDFDKGFSKHECQKSAVRELSEQALFWHKCFEKFLSKSTIGIEYYSNAKIFVLVYSTGNVFRLALSRFFAYKFFALVQSYKLLLNRKIKEKHREIGGFCIRLIDTKKISVFCATDMQ